MNGFIVDLANQPGALANRAEHAYLLATYAEGVKLGRRTEYFRPGDLG